MISVIKDFNCTGVYGLLFILIIALTVTVYSLFSKGPLEMVTLEVF